MSQNDYDRAEPLEALFKWIGSNEVSIDEALESLIESERSMYVDVDDFVFSMTGLCRLHDRTFNFGLKSFYFLHRGIYEFDEVLDVPSIEVARLCLYAARRIQFITAEFSFHNALSFCLEKQGRIAEAYQHYWVARTLADKQVNEEEFQQTIKIRGRAVLVDPYISKYPKEEDNFTKELRKTLQDAIVQGRLTGDVVREFHGWRGQAFIECGLGNPHAAAGLYTEAIRCAGQTFGPVPLLLLQGDRLWAALRAKEKGKDLEIIAEELIALLDQLPSYMACHPMLIRVANFCKAIGLNAGEQKCRNAAARCFVRRQGPVD